MTFLAVPTFSPSIPDAGVVTTFVAMGDPSNQLRWYVVLAPISSTLIDRDVDPISAMKLDAAKHGVITFDVPGEYWIEARDVSTSQPLPKYAGQIVASGSDDDDRLWDQTVVYAIDDHVRTQPGRFFRCVSGHVNQEPPNATYWREENLAWSSGTSYLAGDRVIIPTSTLYSRWEAIDANTNQSPAPGSIHWRMVAVGVQVWVAQTVKRTIGEGPTTATLSIRMFDDEVVSSELDPKAVTLTPANDPQAKIAVYDASVTRVLDEIRALDSSAFRLLHGSQTVGNLAAYYISAIQSFNAHLGRSVITVAHGAADAVNTVSAATVSTLATAIVRLNAIRAALIAHAALGTTTHLAASVPSITLPTMTDFGDLEGACMLFIDLYRAMGGHAISIVAHSDMADGAFFEPIEAPRTLEVLLSQTNALTSAYNAHLGKTSNAESHLNPDDQNVISTGDLSSVAGFITTINTWADRLEAHAFNRDENNSENNDGGTPPVAVPFHAAATSGNTRTDPSAKISFRANDLASAIRLAEATNRAMVLHMLNGSVHQGTVTCGADFPGQMHLTGRLTKSWLDVIRRTAPVIPERYNEGAVQLLSTGWTT